MKIDRVTITGADDGVDIKDLIKLSEEFPFVEWGILFSQNNGRERYPSDLWLSNIVLHANGVMNLSAHFCGWWAKQILENKNYTHITASVGFDRIQLNYNFKNSKGWDLGVLLSKFDQHNHYDGENIRNKKIILQYNDSNKAVLNKADIPQNFHLLYDASGGRGKEISEIRPPVKNLYTGYAGGIDVYNVENICRVISEVDDDSKVWIDLESGARTNNQFDLNKVRLILEKVRKYV